MYRFSSYLYFIFSVFVFPPQVFASVENTKPVDYIICKRQAEVRTMRIHVSPIGYCTAFYTKDGVDSKVSGAQALKVCKDAISNIKKNLEESQWACKTISSHISEN
jgi:hypothetical protein